MEPAEAWLWPSFVRALEVGRFDSVVAEAARTVGAACTVAVAIANVLCSERGGDEDAHPFEIPKTDRQELHYESTNGELRFVHEWRQAERFIPAPAQITSLRDLAWAIGQVDKLDWKWVDFYAGYHFDMATGGSKGKACSRRPSLTDLAAASGQDNSTW